MLKYDEMDHFYEYYQIEMDNFVILKILNNYNR